MRASRSVATPSSPLRLVDRAAFDRRAVRIGMVTAGVLVVVTVAFAAATPLRFALFSPELDLASHTLGTLVCAAVAALSYAGYREDGGPDVLLQAAAFVALALANLLNTVVVIVDTGGRSGLDLAQPGQTPLYAWAVAQLVAAGLMAAGALAGPGLGARLAARPRLVLWVPGLAMLGAIGGLWLARDSLPVLIEAATLRRLAEAAFSTAPLPDLHPGLLALDGAAAALLLAGAAGYAHRDRETRGIPRTYLVVGLVLAAFAQVHFLLYPAIYSGLVSTGDALRIAFYVVLVAGIHAGTTADVRALRSANARLRLLAAAEADRTAMAERARLARELHDGLAQDLWTAKLEFERLTAELDRPEIAAQVDRVATALDSSLREARDAVDTLRSGFDAGLSFADELPRRLDAFVERTGYVIDLDLDGAATARLPGLVAADLLRIVDEALHNVLKHADATRIRVRVAEEAGTLVVTVQDNGRGFDPADGAAGHGIPGMRERAALIGGRLDIRSAAGDGTTVTVHLPLAAGRR